MRQPENLEELIEWLEWNYNRMEDDTDVICCFIDGDAFHDLLNDLKLKSLGFDYKKVKLNKEV